MTKSNPPARLGDVLERLLSSFGLDKALHQYRLIEAWSDAVGSQIARHTCVDQLRGDRLYILVDSPTWMQELTLLRSDLLQRLGATATAAGVTDLVFRYDPAGVAAAANPPPADAPRHAAPAPADSFRPGPVGPPAAGS